MIVVGKLDTEDMNRYRTKRALLDALAMNPGQFDQKSSVQAVFDHFKIVGELTEKYNLPVLADIDPATGVCFVEYEFEAEA